MGASDGAAATGGSASQRFEVTGVTFDSREVQPGDLFVAMPGSIHDGHKFVEGAFAAGAAGAIVSQPVSGPHVLVAETFAALQALGHAARERSRATIFGVTGSVGKTSTKEALYSALRALEEKSTSIRRLAERFRDKIPRQHAEFKAKATEIDASVILIRQVLAGQKE